MVRFRHGVGLIRVGGVVALDGSNLPAPLTPADCDLRDFQFLGIEPTRLFGSEFHANASDAEWRAGVTLWLKAWHQVPAASIPNDDPQLARLAELGKDVRSWKKIRSGALHGWVLCSDGRLYHPVVAEKVLEGWIEKLRHRLRSGMGNKKRWQVDFDPTPIEAEITEAARRLYALNPNSKGVERSRRPILPAKSGGAGTDE